MSQTQQWWSARRAQNRKPVTYRCPLCGDPLPALQEHMLLLPEGDPSRRRHAHTECVVAERRRGRLPTREEWLRAQPAAGNAADAGAGPWRRLVARLRRR